MRRELGSLLVCLALSCASFARADAGVPAFALAATPAPWLALPSEPLVCPELASPLTLQSSTISGFDEPKHPKKSREKKAKPESKPERTEDRDVALGPERARILLRSLTMPGWGQATVGARRSAAVFALAEAGIWGAFTAFRIQESMRTDTYMRTARQFAGIDLSGRDDEFLRIVGSFASSDEYNLLVVARDAANLYLSDPDAPDFPGYRAYIAEHSLGGANAWNWADEDAFGRYGAQRKGAQKASLRANSTLGLAIANRIVSALLAARTAGRPHPPAAHTWRLEIAPGSDDPTTLRAGLRASF